MNIRLLVFLLFLLYPIIVVGQREPLNQRLISAGYSYLDGTNVGTKLDAKKRFNEAKILYFYNKTIRNEANIGLTNYYLIVGDTTKAIYIFKKVIGFSKSRKIDNGNYSKIKKSKKEEWNNYHASAGLIKIYLKTKSYQLAQNYLEYNDKYVQVTWWCGLGESGHKKFVNEAKKSIDSNLESN